MMNRTLWLRVAIFLLPCLPFLALMIAGGWVLWQEQLILIWAGVLLSFSGIAWILTQRLNQHESTNFFVRPINPETPFSQRDQEAWSSVEALSDQIKKESKLNLEQVDTWLQLGQSALAVVAQHYRPNSKKPELEIPATQLLSIIEKVSHDIHKLLNENIPFSHQITLADGLNIQAWIERLSGANTVLRLSRMVLNPLSGVLSEAKNYAQGKASNLTQSYLKNWLLDTYIKKVGYYAILLYSGRMAVNTNKFESLSSKSQHDKNQAIKQKGALEKEPLRILIAGQTNAGKSTLINTLFDKPCAAADVVSCTSEITPYQLEQGGELSGLIFDTPGYGEQTNWLKNNREELDKTDLVLLVCQANNAARIADRNFIQEFQEHFETQVKRKLPPVILVVTHIDQLRPSREWRPPYNILEPNCTKSRNIRAAVDAIQQDLSLPESTIMVPVSLGFNDGLGVYNVDSLLQAIGQQMSEANRARLLRCISDTQAHENLSQLWKQVTNSGRWIWRKVDSVLP